MTRHLTERDLIEYQFTLASEARMEELGGHLQGCGECRKRLEQLKRKFAALDLLREEPELDEEFISRVVEGAGQPVSRKVVAFRRPAWVGAAAAVFVAGLLLLASRLNRDEAPSFEVAREQAPPGREVRLPERPEVTRGRRARKDSDERTLASRAVPEGTHLAGKRKGSVEAVFELAPFAPASAIELVTLPRRDEVQITIYNSADLTLVRERRNLTLKKGWNWLQFMWANTLIDPTSLSLEPLEQRDMIDIQQLVFPARLRELGRWLIRSETSGQVPFEITYFTSGLSWRAFYMGTLAQDERKMRLQGYVRVTNRSGEDYENTQTRLLVGRVHILDEIAGLARSEYPYGRPDERELFAPEGLGLADVLKPSRDWRYDEAKEKAARARLRPKEIRKEGLSEYFLYTIEGTETIPDSWGKRLLSFDVEDISVKSLYKYDEERWGNQVIRFVAFANDDEHNLGQTPIPDGQVKIYSRVDEQGQLSYVGGTNVKYIPVDEEVELNLGSARLVRVEPVLMDFKTDSFMFDGKGNVAGWDEIRTWKIAVTNARTLPVEVEISRGFPTAYWTLTADDKDFSYEKHDATHARFKLTLQPRSKQILGYVVTTHHGVRERAVTE